MSLKLLLVVLVAAVVWLSLAEEQTHATLEPVYTVDNLFEAVNGGDLNTASTFFATDAVARITMTHQSYENEAEIRRFLEDLHGVGRAYEIVQLNMEGDTVNITVNIADQGHVWAQQKMTAVVHEGRIHDLAVTETRLTLWRISW